VYFSAGKEFFFSPPLSVVSFRLTLTRSRLRTAHDNTASSFPGPSYFLLFLYPDIGKFGAGYHFNNRNLSI